MDWLDFLAVQGTLQESSPTPQFKSINSSVLSLLHSPTLTSIHDHRKTIAMPVTFWVKLAFSVLNMAECIRQACILHLWTLLGMGPAVKVWGLGQKGGSLTLASSDGISDSIQSHHFMANRWGNSGNIFSWALKSLQMVTVAMKLKDGYSLEEKLLPT